MLNVHILEVEMGLSPTVMILVRHCLFIYVCMIALEQKHSSLVEILHLQQSRHPRHETRPEGEHDDIHCICILARFLSILLRDVLLLRSPLRAVQGHLQKQDYVRVYSSFLETYSC